MNPLPSIAVMRRAFAAKDPAFDGLFIVAVRTTGIFCRPTCRARPPRPENVEFFPSPAHAVAQGYRPCKLCRPTDPPGQAPAIVERLKDLAAAEDAPLRGDDLRELGIDPTTARRQFRAHLGVTFAGYQRSLRMGTALSEIRRGATATTAQVAAGFDSPSGFRDAFARLFGTAPTSGTDVRPLAVSRVATPIGPMVAIADEQGLYVLDFLDRRGLPGAIQRLQSRLGACAVVPGENEPLRRIRTELAEYFAGERTTFTVPLAPRGTPFEERAWGYLRSIPPGQTRTYGEQAKAIGAGGGARAVGRANGMNYLSILIPCHRVVGANGALTGYGGGLWRKRWLLDHERKMITPQPSTGIPLAVSHRFPRQMPHPAACVQGGT